MEVICSNKILVKNPTLELKEFASNKLTLPNPEFYKKEAMGKWTGSTPKDIVLYEKYGYDTLILPFGVVRTLYKDYVKETDTFIPRFANNGNRKIGSSIKLYPYQERAVRKAVGKKNGIIVMPCGSGKTQTALELVARLGKKTLWLTHTLDLLNQSMERAKSCLDLPQKEYGTITGGKVNVGNTITFATVQTMCNIDLQTMKYQFDVIVVDECHKCVGTPTNVMMFYKVLSNLASRYKFGLTATPQRADGLEQCMFSLIGDTIDEVTKEEVKEFTCPVEVNKILTGYTPNLNVITAGDGTIVYGSLIDDIINNQERNQTIVDELKKCDGACLILSDRLAHLDTLYRMLGEPSVSRKLDGISNTKASKLERKQATTDLNNGKIKYLFATYKLAKEGLDIPNLRYLVMATPQKDYTTVVQSTGRVGRKAEGKTKGIVLDFVDDFGLLLGYSRKRNNIYKKLDYTINII